MDYIEQLENQIKEAKELQTKLEKEQDILFKRINQIGTNIRDWRNIIYKEECRHGELLIKNFLKEKIQNIGGYKNCYQTRGRGFITLDDFNTIFNLQTTKGYYSQNDFPFLKELRTIMKKEKIVEIEFNSPTKNEDGCYYPFYILINRKNYSLFEN